jgi:glycyl-tRNA synthetase beta chain
MDALRARLKEPAELALADELARRGPAIDAAVRAANYGDAMRELAALRQPVDRFFTDVLVMAEDPDLRDARLTLLTTLRQAIREQVADVAEIAAD